MNLDTNLKNQLKQYFELIENPVKMPLSLDQSQDSLKLKEFVNEVTELTDNIIVEETKLPLTPSFALNREEEETGIVFAGVPMGHELESFVLAVLQVGGRPVKTDETLIQRIKEIDKELHFETIVSLSCHNCPEVVQALNIMSLLNPKISHTLIEGGSFQDLVEERGIIAVPTVFLNGEKFSSGRMNLEQILEKLIGLKPKDEIENLDPFDIVIIGGGPAGATAAIYAARKGVRTGLIAQEFGGQVNDTLGIENITGITYIEGPRFMKYAKNHVDQYGVEIITGLLVDKLESDKGIKLSLNNGAHIMSKSVIVATGARWKMIGIPGEVELRNKGVSYCTHCDGPLFKNKTVAVIGGGNSGVEAAIDLAGIVREVILLEYQAQLQADDFLQDRLRAFPNVRIITNAQTTEIKGKNRVNGITYINRETKEENHEEIQGCFIQIGLKPNTEWLEGLVRMNPSGEIIVDKKGATSLEGVYAAGDCTDCAFKQVVISTGSGATAAIGAYNYLMGM